MKTTTNQAMIKGKGISLSPKQIEGVKEMVSLTGYSLDEICGKSRVRRISFARHAVMAFLRTEFKLSLKTVGGLFSVNHSLVLYAIEKVNDHLDNPDDYAPRLVKTLKKMRKSARRANR
jgi:chromosomal replication initiation ATPase DnaA